MRVCWGQDEGTVRSMPGTTAAGFRVRDDDAGAHDEADGRTPVTHDPLELFVGQMIALLPCQSHAESDAVQRSVLRALFPRFGGQPVAVAERRRPRVYSLILDGEERGILLAGGTETDVRILPLDVQTPSEATAFRITAMSGRALRVRGVAEGDARA